MTNKTLGLIFAGGEGSRVREVLGEDEKVKAMIKIGRVRLVDICLKYMRDSGVDDIAVLSYPSELYSDLDKRVEEHGVKVLKQKVKHRKLWSILALPYILLTQYHFSKDKEFLQGFDNLLTMPCDMVFENIDLKGLLNFHNSQLTDPMNRQLTMLCGKWTGKGKVELFNMEGDKIIGRKKYKGHIENGYEALNPAGVYVLSEGILREPYMLIFGFKRNAVYRYLLDGSWKDFGNPDVVRASRKH